MADFTPKFNVAVSVNTGVSDLKVTTQPVVLTKSLIHPLVVEVNQYIKNTDRCTPVGAAKKLHELMVAGGLRAEDDEIFYDFEERYKVKFTDTDGLNKSAVFWAPWVGGVSWRITEDSE